MSVIDWSEFPEPWRSIGSEFSEMLPALSGDPPPWPPWPPRSLFLASLADLRKKLGLSQRELARRVGCHAMTIGDYERGRSRPSQAMRDRLAAILLPEPPP